MERYQLSLSAQNLPKRGLFSSPSPYATVKIASGSQQGIELGETEIVESSRSPDWCEIFFLNFSHDEVTNLEVTIWDAVKGKTPVKIADVTIEAASVFQEKGNHHNEQIGRKKNCQLHCHIEKSQLGSAQGLLNLQVRGLDIKNVEPGLFGLGRSDPFFEISKKDFDHSISYVKWNVVYRSEHIKNHLNPYWKEFDLDLEKLCYGDLDRAIRLTVKDYNNNGDHKVIGHYETTVTELQTLISIKGNADRDKAIKIGDENSSTTFGSLCILKATVFDNVPLSA